MFSPTANNETRQPASAIPVYAFEGLVTEEFDNASADAAIALLRELARVQEFENRSQEARVYQRTYEYNPPLQRLPPSEWRSLGGYFDYSLWADRDRFMELDRAIAASRQSQIYELDSDAGMI